jgi:hypothetical protein
VIDQALLAESVGKLDAGTRAMLDLSLRRAIPDDQVAKVLGVDAKSIPPRRARGIAQLADMMEIPGPSELAALLIAIPELPEEAWGVPAPVPVAGGVTRARRAKAFRRVAIAASPLVALGAVMAAVVVASTDHSDHNSAPTAGHGGAGGTGRAAATAVAPDQRHSLPPGVRLTLAHNGARHHSGRRARHHQGRRHGSPGGSAEPAILTRAPSTPAPAETQPVVYNPPPAAPQQPQHVTHHHQHAPSKPKTTPPSAPVQTPSTPVSTPAPTPDAAPTPQTQSPAAVEVTQPQVYTHNNSSSLTVKQYKPPVPQPDIAPSSGVTQHSTAGGGSCGHGGAGQWQQQHSYSSVRQGSWQRSSSHSVSHVGKPWTPPGLFRKRH